MSGDDFPAGKTEKDAAACGSCGRFIGPAAVCPYCDAPVGRSVSLRVLRIAALLMATGGLAVLFWISIHREVGSVAVRDLTPAMNFGMVQVRGTVVQGPYLNRREGQPESLSFVVDDGTGRIRVTAGRSAAARLAEGDGLPAKGDEVRVSGSLNLPASGEPRLYVQSARQLTTTRKKEPPPFRQDGP